MLLGSALEYLLGYLRAAAEDSAVTLLHNVG